MRKQKITEGNWDYLIILDACRYDTFKKLYPNYLEGELKKRKSPGSSTAEWLEKTFPDKYDYTYVSGNPFVNSKKVPLSKTATNATSEWDASEHFKEIIDSWDKDCDEKKGTVRPEDLTDTAIKNKDKKKMIVHYMQPHRPFINCKKDKRPSGTREKIISPEKSLKDKLVDKLAPIGKPFYCLLPYSWQWEVRKLLGLGRPIISFKELQYVVEDGKKGVRRLYEENLEIALREVARLIKQLDGKIVITADHGERLGKNNELGHQYKSNNPVLRTVPWFTVKGVKK